MATPKPFKPRIGTLTAFMLIGFATLCWGIMVLLSFFVVTEVISWGIGAVQDIFLTLWLFFLGVYSGERNRLTKLISTIVPVIIELIPFLNDIPVGIIEIGILIFIVRAEDVRAAAKREHDSKKAEGDKAEQEAKNQASHAAQLRAQAQREQAMKESLARAA